jgi:hypothetical protein
VTEPLHRPDGQAKTSSVRAGHRLARIPVFEVETFRRRYLTLAEFSRRHRLHHAAAMNARRDVPAIDLGKTRVKIYRRDDTQAAGFALAAGVGIRKPSRGEP